MNYYNEYEPYAAAWLKNLIADGLIPDGDVDDRSILDVKAEELKGYTQCHFFAGIGGWSLALRIAGWPDDRPVWTGSCPCQSYSTAGAGGGRQDERHLWPAWRNLIRECQPTTIFGEQVAAAIAYGWIDEVFHDLENEAYACAAAILPACSIGAPHKRDRIFFMAHAAGAPCDVGNAAITGFSHGGISPLERPRQESEPERSGSVLMAYGACGGSQRRHRPESLSEGEGQGLQSESAGTGNGISCVVANSGNTGLQGHGQFGNQPIQEGREGTQRHPWASGLFIACADGKQRLTEPSICLLANGVSGGVVIQRTTQGGKEETHTYNRKGTLMGFGNAIVPQVAAEFIGAGMECIDL